MAVCGSDSGQQWATDIPTSGDPYYYEDNTLRNNNGSCLTTAGRAAGGAVVVAPCADTAAQDWYVWGTGGSYNESGALGSYKEVANRDSGLCLSLRGNELVQQPCSESVDQQWGSPTNAF
jgi:hypothetical protein